MTIRTSGAGTLLRITNNLEVTYMTQQSSFSMPAINLFGQGTINEAGTRLKDVGAKKHYLLQMKGYIN